MTYQPELDFVHTRENNAVSQKILDTNRVRLSDLAKKALKLLTYGFPESNTNVFIHFLTVDEFRAQVGSTELRTRICDIEKKGVKVCRAYAPKGIAVYWLDEENQIKAKQLLNTLK